MGDMGDDLADRKVWASSDLEQRVTCPASGCAFEFRAADAAEGLAATERYCRRCRAPRLIVTRGAEVVGVAPLEGRRAIQYRDALMAAGDGELTMGEVEMLVKVAHARVS